MPVDYGNPSQVQQFKQHLLSKGYSPTDVESYVSKKASELQAASAVSGGYLQMDQLPQDSRIGTASILQSAGVPLPAKPEELSGEEKKQTYNAASGLRALSTIREELGSGGKGKLFAAALPGSPGARKYSTASKEIADVLTRLRTGAQINDFELEFYQGQLPSVLDSKETVDYKLKIFEDLFSSFTNGTQRPMPELGQGMDVGMQQETPEIPAPTNVSGYTAKQGDLVRDNETGKLVMYGSGNTDPTFKQDKTLGLRVDNSLIKFLADSSFLPIVGGVAGGVAGGFAGGVGGSMAGKAAQQYLRELTNPDQAELSDHARVILTEGVADAVFSGLFLGVGKIAKGTYGIVLRKYGQELAEGGAKEASEGAFKSRAKGLVRKGLGITPTEGAKYTKSTGGQDFAEDVLAKGIPGSPEEAIAMGESGLMASKDKLKAILNGKSVRIGDVIKTLEEAKAPYLKQSPAKLSMGAGGVLEMAPAETVVSPAAKQGIKQIDEYIAYVKKFGGDGDVITGAEANKLKTELQEAFGSGLNVSGASQKAVAGASTKMKKLLEDLDPSIKGTNKEIIFYKTMQDLGLKGVSREKAKSMLSLIDVVIGTASPQTVFIKKGVEQVAGDPLQQAKLMAYLANLSGSMGNRAALSGFVSAAMRTKVPFGISPILLNSASRATSTGAASAISDRQLPEAPPDLGAFSPEGVPLYR